ncbi:hypothetical protein D6764_04360 [Candidatus Woesearchaeota archaeon]|nr:MAG: hypothetical protein D6764_04360 [Candidatus Woesearchaeota archaeon]
MKFEKKIFSSLKRKYEGFDRKREDMIRQTRSVIKLSKQVIYALHRRNYSDAKRKLGELKAAYRKLLTIAKEPQLRFSGNFRSAAQEFVEAVCFYELVSQEGSGALPDPSDLKVDFEEYLLGICDVVGELGRTAVHSVARNDLDAFSEIKKFVSRLYEALLEFDFRNGDLRRKFDSVKYTLNKLEDIELDVVMRKRNLLIEEK